MLPVTNRTVSILAGTEPAGGAIGLFPVVNALRGRPAVEVQLLGRSPAVEIFREYGLKCHDLSGRQDLDDTAIREIVEQNAPELILTGVAGPIETGLDYRLLRAARALGLPTLGVLDSWMNYASRFADPITGDPLAYLPDRLAVLDERAAEELAAEGIPADRLEVTGHPFVHLLRQRSEHPVSINRLRQSVGAESGDRVVVFFSEPLRWSVEQGLNATAGYDEFAAFTLLAEALSRPGPRTILVVKEHPRQTTLLPPDWLGDTRVVTHCPLPAADLLDAADAVAGMSSTVLVWAYLLGRKVLVIQPGLHKRRDRNMLTRRGILPNLQSAAEVAEALSSPMQANLETLEAVRRELGWYNRPDQMVAECALKMCALPRPVKHAAAPWVPEGSEHAA